MRKHINKMDYIEKFPELRKWINECIYCHSIGYDPKMPEHVGGEYSMAAYYIRKLFQPLYLNEQKICCQCEKVLADRNKR